MFDRADLFYKAQKRSSDFQAKLEVALREAGAARAVTTEKEMNAGDRRDVSVCDVMDSVIWTHVLCDSFTDTGTNACFEKDIPRRLEFHSG